MPEHDLVVGLDDALPPPMQMGNPESGDFRGYEVDLLNEIAVRLNATLRYRRAFWSRIIEELKEGQIDVICSAATISDERRKTVDFSRPYLDISLAEVSRATKRQNVRRVGVRRGTTAEDYAQTHHQSPTLLSESNDELYDALAKHRVDVIIDDSPIASYFARQTRGWSVQTLPETEAAYALVLKRGNSLRARIDAVLDELEMNGTLTQLRKQWELAS